MIARDRERGWRETLERYGADVPPVVRGDWSARSGYRAGQSLAVEAGVCAVFTANDHMALGLLAAFAEAGMRVPRDAHVVGFDDVPEAAYFAPPLTTVRQDFVAASSHRWRCSPRDRRPRGPREQFGPDRTGGAGEQPPGSEVIVSAWR